MRKLMRPVPVPDWIVVTAESWTVREPFRSCGGYGPFEEVQVCLTENEGVSEVKVYADNSRLKRIRLRWNGLDLHGSLVLGDCWERSYNEMSWRGISARRHMPWYFFLLRDGILDAYGVKVRPGAFCFWEADSDGISLYMDLRSGGRGVLFGGRTLNAAEIVHVRYTLCEESGGTETQEVKEDGKRPTTMQAELGPVAMDACRNFCSLLCTDPILPDHPVYGSNNWYYAYGKSSREQILKDTDYLVSLTKGLANRPYMVIDDGWQPAHSDDYNGGPWRGTNADYGDLVDLAAGIKNRGAIPGIWFRPLQNRDPSIPAEWRIEGREYLDPSLPEVLDYVRGDIHFLCEAGFRLIKHDFSTFDMFGKWGFQMAPLVTDDGWGFYDQSRTSAEIVTDFYRMIHDECSKYGTIVLGCNTVGHLGAGLMECNRIGDDTSGLNWERTRSVGINTLAFRLMQNKTFYEADADCVGITGAISWKYNRQWADLIARSGTSLFVSAKPGVLSPEEDKELAEIFRMASEGKHESVPTDWLLTDCPEKWLDGEKRIHYHWYPHYGTDFTEGKYLAEPFMSSI